MAKQQLGTKRICPETSKKFYDLGRDPVVSPYTGISYPVSAFDLTVKKTTKPAEEPKEAEKEVTETAEVEVEDTGDVEVVSLEDAEPKGSLEDDDDDDDDNADVIPDIDTTDIDGDDAVSADDDTFLEDDDEDADPAVAVVAGRDDDDT
ncbi:MAG: TIGR02300 family protein [Hyphomicrobiales bacterium]